MVGLIQNDTVYEYDIRSLVLAFLIGEKIELTDHVDSIYDFVLDVFYEEEQMRMTLYQEGSVCGEKILTGDYRNKKVWKNPVKRAVYQLFSKALGKELPWGTLTGIRPTKIVFDGFAKGKTQEQIIRDFQKDYLASEEKAALCTKVVKTEQELLSRFPYEEGYSLYVGIPFCPSTCLYCSFASYPIRAYQEHVKAYLDALEKEILFVKEHYKGQKPQTLYIGGGTPTSLERKIWNGCWRS